MGVLLGRRRRKRRRIHPKVTTVFDGVVTAGRSIAGKTYSQLVKFHLALRFPIMMIAVVVVAIVVVTVVVVDVVVVAVVVVGVVVAPMIVRHHFPNAIVSV